MLFFNNNVRLENQTISSVIIAIKDSSEPDRLVVIGGQTAASSTVIFYGSDAWISGGWRPLRTVILVSWGAEQYNLASSTAWIHQDI